MIRIIKPMQISPGRDVRPIRPLLIWELPPGITLTLPADLEASLISNGMAEPASSKPENKTVSR